MTDMRNSAPVVAGIDGSPTAVHAALWAADEAESLGAPMRLVYATKEAHQRAGDYAEDVRRGHAALRQAHTAIDTTGKRLTVETEVVSGPPAQALLCESEEAQMICVGTVGISRYARSVLGSTAAELAEGACCPVAVIRPDSSPDEHGLTWIVVAMTDQPEKDSVVEHALREATLRHVPVLALGDDTTSDPLAQQLDSWQRRYPRAHVYPIPDRAGVSHFLRDHDEPVLLSVIGRNQAGQLAQIVGQGHPAFHHSASSALIVR
ncbi:universal stress protein [Mycolicibacterium obuense]|uniref:Universal stress protein n=1 Tax=Mycolicibacterium obuense TaxID=1807 RepID=A0A4R5XAQ1_9MYCO|nr:universal stress protein [Mycolicibacterium obuense]TDL09942.1 universal stress protein [Mycolicibacterium obuense]